MPGFLASEPNIVEYTVDAVTADFSAATLDLTIEARVNQPGGIARVRLRNWSTNQLQQVHQYAIGTSDAVETIEGLAGPSYIDQVDGAIQMNLRLFMLATFSPIGFDSFTDHLTITPE